MKFNIYKYLAQCDKNNLILRIKTEHVTGGTNATE